MADYATKSTILGKRVLHSDKLRAWAVTRVISRAT